MASGEASQTSIGTASPLSSRSSSDLIEETIPPVKNAWSEIVRGASHAPRSKVALPTNNYQPVELQDMHHHTSCEHTGTIHPVLPAGATTSSSSSMSALVLAKLQELDARITEKLSPTSLEDTAGFVDAPPTLPSDDVCSLQMDKRELLSDLLSETSLASPDGSAKGAHPSPVKSPKPAWGKPASKAGEILEPEPVMGAMAWPALTEARSVKSFEGTKSAKLSGKSSLRSVDYEQYLKAPPSLREELGENRGVLSSPKSFNQHRTAGNGNISTDSTSSKTVKITHVEDSGQSKRPGSREAKIVGPAVLTQRTVSPVSSTPGNNFSRDQARRSNQGWPTHGRGYANSRDNAIPPQHQWATNRNLQPPFVPFFNPNPGFVHAAGFHNVPGSMYYIPAPPPEPLLGATYFVPPVQGVVQGVMVPGPDPRTMQRMLVHQIEYYFSVENLCRDIYLRSNMDEQGFVPISLIGTFNRVRNITQNPLFIVEALQASSAVEVQGDKVRKRGDWAKWLLPSSQKADGVSIPSTDKLSNSLRKVDIDQSRAGKMGSPSNGLGYLTMATEGQEKLESYHGSRQHLDPLTPGLRSSGGGDQSVEKFMVDEKLESKQAGKYTEFPSHMSIT